MPSRLPPLVPAPPEPAAADLDVRGFSYEDRRAILPALAEALAASGCWLHDSKNVSHEQMEYRFDLPLRSAVDLYSGLVGSGLELTRASHAELTGLCVLRRHNQRQREPGRVIGVCLKINFLDEVETLAAPPSGHA